MRTHELDLKHTNAISAVSEYVSVLWVQCTMFSHKHC